MLKVKLINVLANSVFLFFVLVEITYSATIQSGSVSYADVSNAVLAANVGDTVLVPAGSETWQTTLTITKGINLVGAGIDQTIITSDIQGSSAFVLYYNPSNPENNEVFALSGFTIDCAGKSSGLKLLNSSLTPLTKVRIHHNKIFDSASRAIWIAGHIYGVIDNNILIATIAAGGPKIIDSYGFNKNTWDNFSFEFGTANNIYYEDNTITGYTTVHSAGQGGRYSARFNKYIFNANVFPWFDMHGNQHNCPDPCSYENFGTMGAEIYRNTAEFGAKNTRMFDQRGGKAMIFDNTVITTVTPGDIQIREEYDDTYSPILGGTTNPQPQHVSDSYSWNNMNGRVYKTTATTSDWGDNIAENEEYWIHKINFDGSSGVGVGTFAEMSSITICSAGVGFWVTDRGSWNANGDDGQLYRCNSQNNWVFYYEPYAYPHPLRQEVNNLLAPLNFQTKSQ